MSSAPAFLIQTTPTSEGLSARIRVSIPHDDKFRVKSMVGSLTIRNLDDLSVDVAADGDTDIAVLVRNEGRAEARLATLTPLSTLTEREKHLFIARLGNAVDSAFGDAVFNAVGAMQGSAVMGPGGLAMVGVGGQSIVLAAGNAGSPSSGGHASRWVLGATLALAVALIAFGVYRQVNRTSDANAGELATAGATNNALEAKIRNQIDQAVKNPGSVQGFQGENVALATMKAMGLNPGKANAGCLVGVGK
jgi:hypothetical protein